MPARYLCQDRHGSGGERGDAHSLRAGTHKARKPGDRYNAMRHTLIASLILLTGCTPRVIERIKTVTVQVPVAAPCPLPADVVRRPLKTPAKLPDNAELAAAVLAKHGLAQDAWGDIAERQIAACSAAK